MTNTPRGYPYPALTDAPAGPGQIENLAQAVDTDVTALEGILLAARGAYLMARDPSNTLGLPDTSQVPIQAYDGAEFDNGGGIVRGSGGTAGQLFTPSDQSGNQLFLWSGTVSFPPGAVGSRVRVGVLLNGSAVNTGAMSAELHGGHITYVTGGGFLILGPGVSVQMTAQRADSDPSVCSPLAFALVRHS